MEHPRDELDGEDCNANVQRGGGGNREQRAYDSILSIRPYNVIVNTALQRESNVGL
jgi:hypothetical protein